MKKYLLLLLVPFIFESVSAQPDALSKITKYVIAKTEASFLYQEPNEDSPVLAIFTQPDTEEEGDSGDGSPARFRWEKADMKFPESEAIKASVLPVIGESETWYQVLFSCQEEWLEQMSETAYVPKSKYIVSHIVGVDEQKLQKLTAMSIAIRREGRYKDYCMVWGPSEMLCGSVLYVGKIINNIACLSNCRYYEVDEEKQVAKLYEEYEVGAPTIDFGKSFWVKREFGYDVDFSKLTDDDVDRIIRLYDKQYDKAYVNIDGSEAMYIINLAALKEIKTVVFEENPEFEGGEEALSRWLTQNVKYPKQAEENAVTGRVLVSFVVDVDGTIKDVKVVRSVDPSLDKEAVRVVKSMPKWKPGKRNGEPVPVRFSTTINFYRH